MNAINGSVIRRLPHLGALFLAALCVLAAGCQTSKEAATVEGQPLSPQQAQTVAALQNSVGSQPAPAPESLTLREGDVVKIVFPGAPNLNAEQQIRRDGKIALALVGEVTAAGLTPPQLEKRLLEVYGDQIQTKEVTVSIASSAFPVYVSGFVMRPGKIMSDRPLTAMEAIMEAGGFDPSKANMKKVRVIRYENGRPTYFTLDLKAVLEGKGAEAFKLKPSDLIYVPERFAFF
jgi:polysaccharide export outer membrane protein